MSALDRLILAHWEDGKPPSAIDSLLKLKDGTSRAVIVREWTDDRAFGARMMRHG